MPALDDSARLEALQASGLLGGEHQSDLDALLDLATRMLGVPVGLVSVVDDRRQHFVGQVGLSTPDGRIDGTPLSHSFCQFVVVDDDALVVTDARSDTRVAGNGAIDALGVIAYCGVPIRDAGGQVLGSFCAIDSTPHEWSADDVQVLRTLADAVTTRIAVETRHQHLIRSLQRHSLPELAVDSPSWRMSVAYRPAMSAGIGGDFYDVETHQDGSLTIVIGDVVGHGLEATVAMAQLQAAVRTARVVGRQLERTVEVLDEASSSLEGVPYAALVLARFAADGSAFEHISSGFLPPLVVRHDGTTEYRTGAQTPPIGFPATRATQTTPMDAGIAGVVFTTDGLIERRGEDIDVGLARLAERAPQLIGAADPAGALADDLGLDATDDVAVVVVRPTA